jgi:hypothetical protein
LIVSHRFFGGANVNNNAVSPIGITFRIQQGIVGYYQINVYCLTVKHEAGTDQAQTNDEPQKTTDKVNMEKHFARTMLDQCFRTNVGYPNPMRMSRADIAAESFSHL